MNDWQSTKDGIRASLRDLCALHGAPGFEQSPVAYFQKRVASSARGRGNGSNDSTSGSTIRPIATATSPPSGAGATTVPA